MLEQILPETQIGVLQSMQVGKPHHYDSSGSTNRLERAWRTSFYRTPSSEPRWLHTTHLEGNAQADTENHGSLIQAVLLYAEAHYPLWRAELNLPEIGAGGLGENFTLAGISEETACIGDIYGLGEARIQVTGPRYPCWKIERRWGIEGLTERVARTGRTGWYCRVLQEGLIEPGAPLMLIERPCPQWTIALINDFAHDRNHDVEQARELAACPYLVGFWGNLVVKRAMRQEG